jgi:DNA-binding CsgD family transcriptional regulator
MGSISLIYYVVLILGAIGVISLSYHLQRKYRLKYLLIYFYYLISIHVYWFLVFILPDLLLLILKEDLLNKTSTVYWLFLLFSYPVIMISLYLFASFFLNLSLEKIPRGIAIGFFAVYILLGLWMIFTLLQSVGDANHKNLALAYSIMRTCSAAIRFGVIAFAFLTVYRLKSKKERHFIKTLCIIYCVGFVIYYLSRREIPFTGNDFIFYLNPFLYFLINIPPLFFLMRYLKGHFIDSIFGQEENISFKRIFEEYRLSQREQEIFYLMLDGKSNKEIGDSLFISPKTVRNHIYSIYKKFGVNNKTLFITRIQKLLKDQKV